MKTSSHTLSFIALKYSVHADLIFTPMRFFAYLVGYDF